MLDFLSPMHLEQKRFNMSETDEKLNSILKVISELKSANSLMGKELDKVANQLQEISKSNNVSAEKKAPTAIKRLSEEDNPKQSLDSKYNIQVVGLGTVKIS